jgi:2-(1,2-epoxy-1,2-dihydrophenyl)acetyl-CoA isomerase
MNNAIEKELLTSGVLILKLNRPEVLNAMNKDLIVGLLELINETSDDDNVRAIIITGNGRGFCAGADLVDGGWPNEDNLSAGQSAGKNMETAFNPLVKAITQSNKPVITAINGIAAGGGVGLALSGDIVIAAESAKFKLVFGPNLGIISDVGSSWFVPNLIGRARANGMGLLGDSISSEQAKDWGLIWDAVSDEELLSKSIEIAERLANGPIEGLKAIVKAHDNALSVSLNDQLDYERDTQEILLDKKEFKEGVSAFIGKRKPNFRDLS